MTPDPRMAPIVSYGQGRTWLIVPCLTEAGKAVDLTVPLSLDAAARLAAGAAAAASHVLEEAARARFLASPEPHAIRPLSTSQPALSD